MPKVTVQYIEEKKNIIMDCTRDLMREVPLYQITMSDIIKKVGCSQGMIYRYYQGVDEIYVNLMNRETKDMPFRDKIDEILEKEENHSIKIEQLFQELGNYILDVQDRIGGKFYYELQVTYAFDKKKQKDLLPTLLFKQNLLYFQEKVVEFLLAGREDGIFSSETSIQTIVSYAGSVIDGIGNFAALREESDAKNNRDEVLAMFKILSNQVLSML